MALKFVHEVTASMAVTDLERSVAWYRSVLGFKEMHRGDGSFCELSTHMTGVNIVISQREQVSQGGGATPVWTVTDIAAAHAHVREAGVRTDGGVRDIPGVVKLLTFFDPDGNPLMFAQNMMQPAE